jgi:putative FmdB family regulatory protein
MPVYEYRCDDCGKKFDIFTQQRMTIEGAACRHCHSTKTRKLISVFASVGGDEEADFSSAGEASGGGCCGGGCGCGCSH